MRKIVDFTKGVLTVAALAGMFSAGFYARHKVEFAVTAYSCVDDVKQAVMFWEKEGDD